MKQTITKILSILCLLGVLACAFIPCMKVTGNYQELISGLSSINMMFPEEAQVMIEEALATQGVTVDLSDTIDSITAVVEPLADGEITIADFAVVSTRVKEVGEIFSVLPAEGFPEPEEGSEDPNAYILAGLNQYIVMLSTISAYASIVSMVLLIPVVLFGILAFFVVLRIILRILGRRGLGVGITFLALLNAVLMVGLPIVVSMLAANGLTIGLETTNVPYIMIGCCIVNCIIWAIGRGSKVKKVKEVVVETPVVEETVVEGVVEAEVETTEETKEGVEETTEE